MLFYPLIAICLANQPWSVFAVIDFFFFNELALPSFLALFGFPGKSDNTSVANYFILYTKQYIYLEN